MDIDNNFEEFPNIEERQKDFNCSIGFTMTVIGSKWRAIILWHILKQEPIHYSQLKKEVVHISHKILSQELKYLERDGLIKRISYPTIPPKVEYLSTKRGKSLESILLELCNWGKQYMR
ncbi:winged helix-turn-helix transcriptional regulator [Clostridioides difficile]|uniref:winged helix-turn-helix transcriptional regulator n=1 Tax=Clostridioides difficile TaxID=1496 RepID=UPI00097FEEE4|nr:helix-turn-helix domain-containing protein [Clostridioides difficile]MBY2230904.1 helix-turn-helix transcriptional regulator [Clostridioides difficile]MCI9996752.1 helix-turn-helix transcriptional regulator [Clostridioides difficile]MCP8401409.1 helix-turn-helix transcriptional regulator [Clostridioides difficile]MCR1463346.1 helix-turn-helix transcriptional regulator [Clostridioides difficile]MCV2272251.1 helix-turn-helix transcriptional regulator [Clostridioides difficile]